MPYTILIVDDSRIDADLLQRALLKVRVNNPIHMSIRVTKHETAYAELEYTLTGKDSRFLGSF